MSFNQYRWGIAKPFRSVWPILGFSSIRTDYARILHLNNFLLKMLTFTFKKVKAFNKKLYFSHILTKSFLTNLSSSPVLTLEVFFFLESYALKRKKYKKKKKKRRSQSFINFIKFLNYKKLNKIRSFEPKITKLYSRYQIVKVNTRIFTLRSFEKAKFKFKLKDIKLRRSELKLLRKRISTPSKLLSYGLRYLKFKLKKKTFKVKKRGKTLFKLKKTKRILKLLKRLKRKKKVKQLPKKRYQRKLKKNLNKIKLFRFLRLRSFRRKKVNFFKFKIFKQAKKAQLLLFLNLLNLTFKRLNLNIQVLARLLALNRGTAELYLNYFTEQYSARKQANPKQIVKRLIRKLKKSKNNLNIIGAKVRVNGRFNRKSRASKFTMSFGRVPLRTLSVATDFARREFIFRFGASSVKLYLAR